MDYSTREIQSLVYLFLFHTILHYILYYQMITQQLDPNKWLSERFQVKIGVIRAGNLRFSITNVFVD
jgi:DMSO/TMAO reductase YedYZ heme-binding membrane subunit